MSKEELTPDSTVSKMEIVQNYDRCEKRQQLQKLQLFKW